MTQTTAPDRQSGQCLCGAVRFTAAPHGGMHACHCILCRRWSGGVFLSVECGDSVEVEDPTALQTFVSSEWAERQSCRTCGSSLFWRMREGGLTAVSIQAFDDPSAFGFKDEIFIDQKPSTYAFAGDRPRLTGEEVFAQFAAGD